MSYIVVGLTCLVVGVVGGYAYRAKIAKAQSSILDEVKSKIP